MQQIQIIGNLGANAQVQVLNGKQYATFDVGVTEKIGTGENAKKSTIWYSCVYARYDAPIIQYLKTGQTVFIEGKPRYQLYDSQKYRCKMIDVSIMVDKIHLCGRIQGESRQEVNPEPNHEAGEDPAPF